MIRLIPFLLIGFVFGINMVKSEALNWFRIQEMFRFQSFHMYGIFMSAVAVGVVSLWLLKKFDVKTINNENIELKDKAFNKVGNVLGGLSFGAGWALTGCCVAPLYVLIGYGNMVAAVILLSALLGTIVYALLRNKLPH